MKKTVQLRVLGDDEIRPLRVLVVDRSREVREAYQSLLTAISTEMVGESETLETALPMLEALQPDVILLEVSPLVPRNLELLPELKSGSNPPAVVLLSNYEDPRLLGHGLFLGADGFLYKNAGAGLLKNAIESSLRGGITVEARLFYRFARSIQFLPDAS